jgi:hypothetical protein
MASISELSLVRNPASKVERPKSAAEAESELFASFDEVVIAVRHAAQSEGISFKSFENQLSLKVMALARAGVVLFLVLAEERVASALSPRVQRGERAFRIAPARARSLMTTFGLVRYWRTYMREIAVDSRRGFHPLDVALGLTAERISMNVLALAVRLATKMSFAEARSTLSWFVPSAPSTEVIEQAVLGLGRHSAEWFESRPADPGDGDVLVMMFDSKGAPTATEEELRARRKKHPERPAGESPRHRARARRKCHGKKPRRQKGDKSKNAKMATMVVMYTLRREGSKLLGPINRRIYASFAPKEHAFLIARREANKRGFTPGSGRTVQIVTDGDNDLAFYQARHFPEAIHTLDVMHIIEKLWSAGECIHREGSPEIKRWVELQKERLYDGRIHLILDELRTRLLATPKTGPGNKGKRERLGKILRHLDKGASKMNYRELLEKDLEIGTGIIEGAIKNVIGKRCDHGGMRWIKERAEALLQLRCIEMNGDWDAFIDRVHHAAQRRGVEWGERFRIQTAKPAPLPPGRTLAA